MQSGGRGDPYRALSPAHGGTYGLVLPDSVWREKTRMDRRGFVRASASGLIFARPIAIAQPAAKVHRIGFFLGATGDSIASLFGALNDGPRDPVQPDSLRASRVPAGTSPA